MSLEITKDQLDRLRELIKSKMSDFRLAHTLGVEKMAEVLGGLYCPEKADVLRAAALLHDVTKELSAEDHILLAEEHDVKLPTEVILAPATMHSITAALIIPEKYPEFSSAEIVSAVRYHTTGRSGMSLCEKLIYLADYIEETRKFEDCIALRNKFFDACPEKMTEAEKLAHLDRVLLHSFDLTISDLVEKGRVISSDTINARNHILFELNNMKNNERI